MNHASPNLFNASAASMMGIPSKDFRLNRSLSPVTRASAPTPTAQARTRTSSGSRNSGGGMIRAGTASRQAVRKRAARVSAVSLWPASRCANFGRWSVSLNSRSMGKEINTWAFPWSAAETSCAGGPSTRSPGSRASIRRPARTLLPPPGARDARNPVGFG